MTNYNFKLLSLAREFRGYSQIGFSEKTGISQSDISKFENGIREITNEIVECYTRTLNLKHLFFEREFSPILVYDNYRKLKKFNASNQKKLESKFNIIISNLEILLKNIELNDFSFKIEPDSENTPLEIANIARQKLNIPNGPVVNLSNILEQNGIIIAELDSETEFSGAAKKYKNICMIFINRKLPADRYRFTLAHELGHLIMHDHHSEKSEKEADEFASEFLMPSHLIKEDFETCFKLGTRQLEELKHKWLTSMISIAYKAKDLKYLQEDEIQKIYRMLHSNRKIVNKQEVLQFTKEKPKLLNTIYDFFTTNLNYSKEEMEKLLGLECSDIEELFNIPEANIFKLKLA